MECLILCGIKTRQVGYISGSVLCRCYWSSSPQALKPAFFRYGNKTEVGVIYRTGLFADVTGKDALTIELHELRW